MKIETWDLLTMRTEALAYMWNATESEVRARRLAHTGHGHVLSAKWAITIGSWGRVRSAAEIEELTAGEISRAEIRDYAKGMNLRTASKTARRTQAELSVLLWCDRGRVDSRTACRAHGVMQVERSLLCANLQQLLNDAEVGIVDLLGWRPDKLEAEWAKRKLDVSPPAIHMGWLAMHSPEEQTRYADYRRLEYERAKKAREQRSSSVH